MLTARVADFSQDHRLGAAQAQLGPAPPRPSDHVRSMRPPMSISLSSTVRTQEISSSSKDKKPKSEVPAANGSTATPVASASTSADTSLDSATKPEPGAVTAPGSTTGTAAGDDEINSDLDDSEDEADAQEVADMEAGGGDLVIALYDKVRARLSCDERGLMDHLLDAGAKSQEQVEGDTQRRRGLGRGQGLPIPQMRRVRLPLSRGASRLVLIWRWFSAHREFEW